MDKTVISITCSKLIKPRNVTDIQAQHYEILLQCSSKHSENIGVLQILVTENGLKNCIKQHKKHFSNFL